jgi:hypothetical protein
MKKLIIIFVLIFSLTSCSLFKQVNDVEVHNQLVIKLDNVLDSEKEFYNAYIKLLPDDEILILEEKYESFNLAVISLDNFFKNTKFASYQNVFANGYNDFYRSFILDYNRSSGDFINELKSRGVIFEVIDKYSSLLDQYSINFVDYHNRMIDLINEQAD